MVREFALRLTGDRKRLRCDFNKQIQEAWGLYFGLEAVGSLTPDGDILIRRADGVRFGDPEMSGKIAALRAAQHAHGLREVANWNLLLKTRLRRELGGAVGAVVVPAELAEDFAWWQRKKMARERTLMQKRVAGEVLGAGAIGEAEDLGNRIGRKRKVKG